MTYAALHYVNSLFKVPTTLPSPTTPPLLPTLIHTSTLQPSTMSSTMDDRRLPPEYLNRFSGAASRIPQLDPIDVPKTPEAPVVPASDASEQKPAGMPWYNPRGWTPCQKLAAIATIAALLVVIIVGAVEGVRANRYPDYTPLPYKLVDTYAGTSFFEGFNYFSDADPTDGFVVYVNQEAAQGLNLTYATDTSAVLRVDSFTPNAIAGRNSVRIESKTTYDTGLFVFDIIHTPYGCGTWPALWLTDGYNWPDNGEIDVLESNNMASHGNEVTLHTTPGCNMNVKRKETGAPVLKNCDNSTNGNAGCGVLGDSSTYGQELNGNGGGVSSPYSVIYYHPMIWNRMDIPLTHTKRCTPSNSETLASEPGSSPAPPSQQTLQIPPARPTLRLGGRRWPTSPARNAISPRISRTRVSSPISICVVNLRPSRSIIRRCIIARRLVRTLWQGIPWRLRRHIGSLGGSGFIRLLNFRVPRDLRLLLGGIALTVLWMGFLLGVWRWLGHSGVGILWI